VRTRNFRMCRRPVDEKLRLVRKGVPVVQNENPLPVTKVAQLEKKVRCEGKE